MGPCQPCRAQRKLSLSQVERLKASGVRPNMKGIESTKRGKLAARRSQQTAAEAAVPGQAEVLAPAAQAQAAVIPPLALATARSAGQSDDKHQCLCCHCCLLQLLCVALYQDLEAWLHSLPGQCQPIYLFCLEASRQTLYISATYTFCVLMSYSTV